MKKLIAVVAIVAFSFAGTGASLALAGNPHCAGNSDNINLPSGHTNNHPACE